MYPTTTATQNSSITPLHIAEDNAPSYRYRAYGLAIRSRIPLPEFCSVKTGPPFMADVSVIIGNGDDWIQDVRERESFWSVLPHEARFWFHGVGGFLVRDGAVIVVTPEPDVDDALLRLYIEGMMMACVLQQRGYYVLHASVIQIEDHAIAFLGHVGAGKSTLAAALHARGHAVVSDDNAAIDLATDDLLVTPAFPSVKVYPAIAASLGYEEHSLRVMHTSQVKRAGSVSRAFPKEPVPLRQIYVLDRNGEDTASGEFRRLTPAEATLELILNSVPTRWRQPGDALHLKRCGELSRRIPISRVRSFQTLEEIPELARRIEQHSADLSPGVHANLSSRRDKC
jgi:hypothetical protein